MPGFVKPCWIASPTERTSSKPELNRIAFDGLSRGRRKEPKHSSKTSRGNAGPWKAWKANFSLSTLPTVLEHPATPAGCSHSHRSDNSFLYKGQAQNPVLNLSHGWARLNFRSGPSAVAKSNPTEEWMVQMARNAVDVIDGTLLPVRYALHDRDTKFCSSFRTMLQSGGVQPILLPPRSPNLNAFAERWVRSIKHECLSKLILFGEVSLRRA